MLRLTARLQPHSGRRRARADGGASSRKWIRLRRAERGGATTTRDAIRRGPLAASLLTLVLPALGHFHVHLAVANPEALRSPGSVSPERTCRATTSSPLKAPTWWFLQEHGTTL